MLKRNRLARLLAQVALASSFAIIGCGEDKKGDDADSSEPQKGAIGNGWVVKGIGTSAEVTLEGALKDAQYLVMPYVLGDPNTVDGAGNETYTFTLTTSAGSGSGLHPLRPSKVDGMANFLGEDELDPMRQAVHFDHMARTLLARFDRSKGLAQEPWFWPTAAKLDEAGVALRSHAFTGFTEPDEKSATRFFQQAASNRQKANLHSSLLMTQTEECPSGTVTVPDSDLEPDTISMPTAAVDKTDFCLVYASEPATESDKTAIEATVSTVIKRFKDTIYKDSLAPVNGFTFKPVIVILDFSDQDLWPTDVAGLQVSGVYLPKMADATKMPMLYMASDFSKIQKFASIDGTLAKKLWHSTIAHELQHAISDYYHNRKASLGLETVAIDEGLAHFMEDVFGYGDENFESYPKTFFDTFAFGTGPFLRADTEAGADSSRGAAQALLYYLASQKGGITFQDGIVSGGDGLAFIVDIVKGASTLGVRNIAAKFGKDWVETIGDYLGALMIDNTTVQNIASKYTTATPVANVSDLTGAQNKTFGMRFNRYKSNSDKIADVQAAEQKVAASTTIEDRHHYETTPYLYTVVDPNAKITVAVDKADVTPAVSVVRIK